MKTVRYELVEQQVPAGFTGNRINFDDQPNLRNDSKQIVLIQGVEAFFDATFPVSPSGDTVVPIAEFEAAFLVLYVGNEESVYEIPLPRLNPMQAAGSQSVFIPLELNNLPVEWSKSYIVIAQGAAVTPGNAFVFGVHYIKGPKGSFQPGDVQQL